MHKAC